MDRKKQLIDRVTRSFEDNFKQPPDLLVSAPGRVNLIGEHTDYNDGFVLPCAIDYHTVVAISSMQDEQIEVFACDYGEYDRFHEQEEFSRQDEEWKNHVRGIVASFQSRGFLVGGARITIGGNIPQGAGLSSSASVGVALGKAIAAINHFDGIDETQIARIAQQSENDFVGCACGIMDQLASARSVTGHAMFLDCRTLDSEPVAIPEPLRLLVVHSGIRRGLVDSAYNERREQCENAARHYGVAALRDLDQDRLQKEKGDLDDSSYRRARHVVTENQRVLDTVKAFKENNIPTLAQLMTASHRSMRDDFEITLPAIDQLVAMIADMVGDSGGVRMTGGGFGGCVIALLPYAKLNTVQRAIADNYRTPEGKQPLMFQCQSSDGVKII